MENIKFEKQGHIGVVTISRPKALNALNSLTLKELGEVFGVIENDEEIYCCIITGEGEKAFVAGADILEMKDMSAIEGRNFGILGNKVFRCLEQMDKPVIAAVNGFALGGGCELALSCDIRIAADNAKFGQPEVGLGITPGFGGTQRLSRLIGTAKAKEMIFTGDIIKADEAKEIGLVNKVVARETLMEEAFKLANKIASNAPIAVRMSKAAINKGTQCDLDTALMYESEVFAQCFSTIDQKDAMNAFLNKTKVENYKNK